MKTLIVYATKYGCTKKCTEIIKSYSKGEVRIVSAKNFKANIEQYDTVIIGGSVYMGKIQKEITHFCHCYKNKLLRRELLNRKTPKQHQRL